MQHCIKASAEVSVCLVWCHHFQFLAKIKDPCQTWWEELLQCPLEYKDVISSATTFRSDLSASAQNNLPRWFQSVKLARCSSCLPELMGKRWRRRSSSSFSSAIRRLVRMRSIYTLHFVYYSIAHWMHQSRRKRDGWRVLHRFLPAASYFIIGEGLLYVLLYWIFLIQSSSSSQ